jgi:ribonuclease T2
MLFTRLLIVLSAVCSVVIASDASAQARGERKGGTPGEFDFYVLALSWSPGFCAAREEGMREKAQCAAGSGNGFVVHGLWPQNETGYPTDCGPGGRSPSRMARDAAQNVYPEPELATLEWRKHGTCSGKSPTEYFSDVKFARENVVVPPAFIPGSPGIGATAEKEWTPLDIERAFITANPGLREDMLAVSCRKNLLQEVRICMTKDLRGFRTCPEVDQRGCRASSVKVAAPR